VARHPVGMRAVLRRPKVLSLFVASCVARLPMGALGLLLVLHTQQITGSYAKGGLAAGAYAVALGLSNPALARIVDRRGQTVVLRLGAPLAAAAILVLALLPDGAPLGAILAGAAAAGMFQPPVGACMRALWPVLLDDPDDRHAAYALEGAMLEIVYICGPLVIVAGIGSWSTAAAMAACSAFLVAGDLSFSAHPVSRGWRPHAEREHDLTGALRGPGVRVLVAVFVLCGLSVGAVEVVVPAALDGTGHRELTGVLLGVWGVGSMVAGLAVGQLGAARDAPRRLAIALVAWGVAHATLGASGDPIVLGLLLLIAGATIAPTFVSANGMLDHLAPAGTLTEAFTWTSTGISMGIAAGSTLAGALVEAASPGIAMLALGGGGVLAGLLVRAASTGPLRAVAPAPA
jgi:predicted MFS family arabinose efflux permease